MRETFAIAVGLLPSPEVFAILFVFMLVVWTIQWFIDLSGGGGEASPKSFPKWSAEEQAEKKEWLQKRLEEEQEERGKQQVAKSRLRTCPDCCEKVSKQATMCPQCGCPLVPSA